MSIFNQDFYPTPENVIHSMTWDLDLKNKNVLEPSAGKGDIVDFCADRGAKVFACENSSDLRLILSQKPHCNLIAEDFLTVTSEMVSHIDYIIMNPPFSADELHINHAFNIAPEGCTIVALCNWHTLENDYSHRRKQLNSIVRDYGSKVNLGNVFSNAERKTDVEIGLIKLYKPKVSEDADFSDYFSMEADDEEIYADGLIRHSYVREIVQRYVASLKQYDRLIEESINLNSMISAVAPYGFKDLTLDIKQDKKSVTKERFMKELQKKSWKFVFDKLGMDKYVTVKVREEINKMIEAQCNIPFTMKNISLAVSALVQNVEKYMDESLIQVFDDITKHHHENRYNIEGWKTNSHYLVNEKFIKNAVMSTSSWEGFAVNRYQEDSLNDFLKALCYITGKDYSKAVKINEAIKNHGEYGTWFDWEFFEVKVFKKGTGHFKFKDRDVWAMFNQRIAKIKGYPLPEF